MRIKNINVRLRIKKALKQFNHVLLSQKRVNLPTPFVPPKYGSKKPQMIYKDTSPPMTPKQKLHLQRIVGGDVSL